MRLINPVRSLVTGLIRVSVVTLSFGVMGVTAAGANADAVDSSFLNALQSKQITFASGQAAVIAGHQVCDALDGGRASVTWPTT